jgi:hypothetical protein
MEVITTILMQFRYYGILKARSIHPEPVKPFEDIPDHLGRTSGEPRR